MALASRTEQPAWASELVELLAIDHRFAFAEIYPSTKLKDFASLRASSGFNYEGIIFFDDEMRNIKEDSQLGATCVHVPHGMTFELFHSILQA